MVVLKVSVNNSMGLIYKISYDNAEVMIDLRLMSNLQNVLQRTQGCS